MSLDGQTQNVGAVAGGARGEPLVIRLQRGAPGHLLESIVRNIAASYPQWPVAKPGDATEAPRLFVVEFRLAGTEDAAKLTQPETRFVEFSLPGRGQSAHRPLREKAERGQR